jgi:hypothetical protein
MSLHNEIMNLPTTDKSGQFRDKNCPYSAYAIGHRDARHAAAELAGQREAELISAIQGLLACISETRGTDATNAVAAAREAIK